jgi:hypothetical protein
VYSNAFRIDDSIKNYYSFDYGAKFWNIKIKSFTCHCNSDTCRYSNKDLEKSEDEASEIEDAEMMDSVQ